MPVKKKRLEKLPEWLELDRYDACQDFSREEWSAALRPRSMGFFDLDNHPVIGLTEERLRLEAKHVFEQAVIDNPIAPDFSLSRRWSAFLTLTGSFLMTAKAESTFDPWGVMSQNESSLIDLKDEDVLNEAMATIEQLFRDWVDDPIEGTKALESMCNRDGAPENVRELMGLTLFGLLGVSEEKEDAIDSNNKTICEVTGFEIRGFASLLESLSPMASKRPLKELLEESVVFNDFSSALKSQQGFGNFVCVRVNLEASDKALVRTFERQLKEARIKYEFPQPKKKPFDRNVAQLASDKILPVLDLKMWCHLHGYSMNAELVAKEFFDDGEADYKTVTDRVFRFANKALEHSFIESLVDHV